MARRNFNGGGLAKTDQPSTLNLPKEIHPSAKPMGAFSIGSEILARESRESR
jgi:hypothetical protein